jgi:hypothetical protein
MPTAPRPKHCSCAIFRRFGMAETASVPLSDCAGSCGPGNLPNAAEQKATTHDGSVSDRDQHIGGRLDRVERSICTLSLSHDRQDRRQRERMNICSFAFVHSNGDASI